MIYFSHVKIGEGFIIEKIFNIAYMTFSDTEFCHIMLHTYHRHGYDITKPYQKSCRHDKQYHISDGKPALYAEIDKYSGYHAQAYIEKIIGILIFKVNDCKKNRCRNNACPHDTE